MHRDPDRTPAPGISRRMALGGLLGLGATLAEPKILRAASPPRKLWLTHAGTGESLRLTYFEDGDYVEPALQAVDRLLRDHHTDATRLIDIRLIDLLAGVQERIGRDKALLVTSAYRTEETNEAIAGRNGYVATRSFHLFGMAADVVAPGVNVRTLSRAARDAGPGGVGAYHRTGHVHLDVGPRRSWVKA